MKPFATTLLASVLALASHRAGAAAPMPSSRTTPSASVVAPVKAKSSADGSALTNVGIGLTVTGLVLGGAGTLALLEAHQEDSLTSGVIAGGCYVLGGIR